MRPFLVWPTDGHRENAKQVDADSMARAAEIWADHYDRNHLEFPAYREVFVCGIGAKPFRFGVNLTPSPTYYAFAISGPVEDAPENLPGEGCANPRCEYGKLFRAVGDGYTYVTCPDCLGSGKSPATPGPDAEAR